MKRVTKLNTILFVIISLMTIVFNLFHFEGSFNINVIFIVLFYLISGLIVVGLAFILYYLSKKSFLEKELRDNFMNKKIKYFLFFVSFVTIISIIFFVPADYTYESTPLIELITKELKAKTPQFQWSPDIN